MIGPPFAADLATDDLDALAALEAAAWTPFYRLGRKVLGHLTRRPIVPTDEERRVLDQPGPADCLRDYVVARLWGENFEPDPDLLPTATLFARCGRPRGALWLDITRDHLAGAGSIGAVQIVRVTVGPADPLAPQLVEALAAFAGDIPANFYPDDWPSPDGRRPVSAFLPVETQPINLHRPLQALGFEPMADEPDAYGTRRPGRFYVHTNGLDNITAKIIGATPR